jgi:NADH-quinone oxidoreductase subunit M
MFVLALEAAMIGVFVSLDLFLFYVFWDAMLVPMYFLIGVWGYDQRVYAAIKFILYTMAGSVLMLVAILTLGYYHGVANGAPSFDLLRLYELQLPGWLQFWGFLAFAVAFAIKVPIFPFHTWLPDAHVQAPTAGSVILAGVLLKMGTYGLVRFAFPLFPDAALFFAPYLGIAAVIGIIYGALVAMVQPDLKKLVAYSSVSHLGFVALGIAAMNIQGVQGAVYQMLAHGVSTGALFLIVGMLSDRRHTRLIAEFGGLKKVLPKLSSAFLVITLASIGLPGLNGFVGELLILVGAFRWDPRLAALAASGVLLSAVYMLWMFQRVNYGPVTNEKNASLPDLTTRERFALWPAVAMAVFMGVFPMVFLAPMEPSVARLVEQVRRNQGQTVQDQRLRTDPEALIPNPYVRLPSDRPVGVRMGRRHCCDGGRGISHARRADADRGTRRHRPPGGRRLGGAALEPRSDELRRGDGRQLRPVRGAGADRRRDPHAGAVGSDGEARRDQRGRVLRAGDVRARRHDADGDGQRSARHLHRARDLLARGLYPHGDPARVPAGRRGGLQVLPAGRLLERVLPLRHRVHLRHRGNHQARSGGRGDGDAERRERDPHVYGARPAARRVRLQSVGGPLPHVDPRRVPGRAGCGDRLHVCGR